MVPVLHLVQVDTKQILTIFANKSNVQKGIMFIIVLLVVVLLVLFVQINITLMQESASNVFLIAKHVQIIVIVLNALLVLFYKDLSVKILAIFPSIQMQIQFVKSASQIVIHVQMVPLVLNAMQLITCIQVILNA